MLSRQTKQTIFLMLAMLLIVVTFQPNMDAFAQAAGDVLIVEVGADPVGADSADGAEFIEIYNATASTVNLENWTISDAGASITFPNIDLEPGKILVVIWNDAALASGGFYNCTDIPLNFSPTSWFPMQLNNDNDQVVLRDASSNLIDAVSYGTDTFAFNPAATDVFNNSGTTLQRQTYNTNFTDTDTANDWVASSGVGTPCDVGPTAVTLQTTSIANGTPLALLAVVVGLLGATAVTVTRRRTR